MISHRTLMDRHQREQRKLFSQCEAEERSLRERNRTLEKKRPGDQALRELNRVKELQLRVALFAYQTNLFLLQMGELTDGAPLPSTTEASRE